MNIDYVINPTDLDPHDVFELFQRAGILKPNKTIGRISRSMKGSAVIVTAWHNNRLIGYSNAISDFSWVGHISQLAVDPEYQGQGIGRNLVEKIKQTLGDEVSLMVHSSEVAKDFYRAIGFKDYHDMFVLPRSR
ncbi:GNAT family N-acetyltransferase [Peredibacter starrii]|uniref:GNAT family N-acetyltransferase n=1 Tax=Peredibacter starrii TaxID=28202 RepID=A0AAX4HN67_9BACT|nr:GNAT family N-acetyltransferase [Peredibacter starrii]WPU64724.1 GNAT family N-acetyltransferase [Peredibacter starrii]